MFNRNDAKKYAKNSEGNDLSHKDVKKLRHDKLVPNEEKWLNDNLINLCFWALQQRDKQCVWKRKKKIQTKNLFFMTHFAAFLTNSIQIKYKLLAPFTQNFDIFEHHRLFFPVNIDDNHWICVVIIVKEQTIAAFDSFGGNHDNLLLLFFRFLCNEHKFRKGEPLKGEWTLLSKVESTPIQKNCHDCGVYTCMFADCLSLGCKIDFTPSDVTTYRKKLAWIMLKDEITNMHKLPQHSPQARLSPDLCNPPSLFRDCLKVQVIHRIKNKHCDSLIVKDIQTSSSLPSSITYWAVDDTSETDNASAIDLSFNRKPIHISHQKQTSMSARMIVVTA